MDSCFGFATGPGSGSDGRPEDVRLSSMHAHDCVNLRAKVE